MSRTTERGPNKQAPKPPFPEQQQRFPGVEGEMQPRGDHGEQSYRGSGRLKGFGTIITGAGSGIGRAVALAFAREGADVIVSYLSEEREGPDAARTHELVEEAGRRAVLAPGDIRDGRVCRGLIERAFEEFGRLDVLVNNAAFQMAQQRIEDITTEQFDATFRANVYALFFLCKAAVPRMKPGAAIVNTASIEAYDQAPYLLDYASSKSAIVGFTKGLARMVADRGIRVNAVAPGPVWTPLIPSTMPPDHVKKFGGSSVFGRPAQPAEIAPLYVWLASPDASYVTGEVFGATDGRTPF